jgi:hypothetical protein
MSEKTEKQNAIVTAARAIGSAAGSVAAVVGIHEQALRPTAAPPAKNGRFPKKNKARLPRLQKKRALKAAKRKA